MILLTISNVFKKNSADRFFLGHLLRIIFSYNILNEINNTYLMAADLFWYLGETSFLKIYYNKELWILKIDYFYIPSTYVRLAPTLVRRRPRS